MIVEPKFQNSFIPKKPITPGGVSLERVGVNFFSIIALAVFLVPILLGAGLYAYNYYLTGHLEALKVDLETAKKQFDPAFIATATRLNSRINASRTLLDKHIAPSYIFSDLLEKYTLSNEVTWSNFKWTYDDAGKATISMTGLAKNYTSVAVQAREFSTHIQYLKDQVFSGISLDNNGNVSFSFSGTIDKTLIDFKDRRSVGMPSATVPKPQTTNTNTVQEATLPDATSNEPVPTP